jgi:5S rRNA maturation endonuclease (ribonuclease M5)
MQEDVRKQISEDLSNSGLVVDDMHARPIDSAERGASGIPFHVTGFVIPYFNIQGKSLPFYRCRLFDYEPKYRQTKDTNNHVYFPKDFHKVASLKDFVVITEGEKKATAAVKHGIPCVGFGGVDSWRNRIITLPAETALTVGRNDTVKAKLPSTQATTEEYNSNLAEGLQDLIDLVIAQKKQVIICYDTDEAGGIKPAVQRAAAALAFELRFKGIRFDHIRQLVLPQIKKSAYTKQKVGLDDFLKWEGLQAFNMQVNRIRTQRSAFPKHPNIREYVSSRLQKRVLSRKEHMNVAMAMLSDLDTSGARFRSEGGLVYYFDSDSKKLYQATFAVNKEIGFEVPFSQFLYTRYGLSAVDQKPLIWLGTQFSSEPPIDTVTPYKVFARPEEPKDVVFMQISDSRFITVSADNIKIHDNGTGGVLFESGQVEPLNETLLQEHLNAQAPDNINERIPNWWGETLTEVRLHDKDRQRVATSLLYYMSPFLHRWRGLQLPVELITGESGSGKSTLCELRLSILTGNAHLRNAPTDLKDWHASVANTGGLHVTDNVQLVDAQLRQRLSDEICRLVTEPKPTIEQRRYYTNAELVRFDVRSVFAITAIRQPFQNADLLQRSMVLEFDKTTPDGEITYNSEWKSQQLRRHGGREAWVAHHMVVLQRFFQHVRSNWNPRYSAKYRLIHFEQAMVLMAKTFGLPQSWVVEYLGNVTNRVVSENDWVLEGLIAYALQPKAHIPPRFNVSDISGWAMAEDEFERCEMLTNTRKLGRYLITNKALVQSMTGITELGKINNKLQYRIIPRKGVSKVQ